MSEKSNQYGDVDVAAEYSRCLFLNTVNTARSLTRKFDAKLAPLGVTAIQYFVMMHIRNNEGMTIVELADLMDMDRSTLTRNLDGLVKKGLATKDKAKKGNAKICVLTKKGDDLLELLIPQWLAARERMIKHLTGRGRRRISRHSRPSIRHLRFFD